jgi:sulfur relay (sulfurtransferase) DsrC/TusE family protein
MNVELSNNEIWKILDAIKAYQKDYAVSGAVSKTFSTIEKKLGSIVKEQ